MQTKAVPFKEMCSMVSVSKVHNCGITNPIKLVHVWLELCSGVMSVVVICLAGVMSVVVICSAGVMSVVVICSAGVMSVVVICSAGVMSIVVISSSSIMPVVVISSSDGVAVTSCVDIWSIGGYWCC